MKVSTGSLRHSEPEIRRINTWNLDHSREAKTEIRWPEKALDSGSPLARRSE